MITINTREYPIRYVAKKNQGTLVRNSKINFRGGYELAVFRHDISDTKFNVRLIFSAGVKGLQIERESICNKNITTKTFKFELIDFDNAILKMEEICKDILKVVTLED